MKTRQSVGRFLAGTYESCYAFLPLEYCGILVFFEGWLRTFWMDFRSEGTRRSVNFSTFFAAKLESGVMRFWGKNRSGAGALSKQGFLPCPSIIRNSQWRTQTPSKSLKKTAFEAKGRLHTTGKVIQCLLIIDLYT